MNVSMCLHILLKSSCNLMKLKFLLQKQIWNFMQLIKSDYGNVYFVLNSHEFFHIIFVSATLRQRMHHVAWRIRICKITIFKIHPMAMTSEMVLSYHFKDSVICPIFTFFVFTFSSIYIYIKFLIDAVLDHSNGFSVLPDKLVIYCKESNIY